MFAGAWDYTQTRKGAKCSLLCQRNRTDITIKGQKDKTRRRHRLPRKTATVMGNGTDFIRLTPDA